jgi:hypothetical protein
MLTLILVFTGFLILAVIGVIIDAQTRHIIVLTGADRYELKKCLNHFWEQRPQALTPMHRTVNSNTTPKSPIYRNQCPGSENLSLMLPRH